MSLLSVLLAGPYRPYQLISSNNFPKKYFCNETKSKQENWRCHTYASMFIVNLALFTFFALFKASEASVSVYV